MNAEQPICERHALPAHLCEHEHPESDAEFSEQVQREACSREVWAADEIPFAVALEVVRRRMNLITASLDKYSDIRFVSEKGLDGKTMLNYWAVFNIDGPKYREAETLDAALEKAGIDRAELANLESAKGEA
jgi:hypothetical protein